MFVLLITLGVLLAVPVGLFVIEVVIGCLGPPSLLLAAHRPRTTVLIPAHNEEAGIGATCLGVIEQLGPQDRLLVVADNCRDSTASVAREAGANVVERVDSEKRGKGHAIAAGLAAAAADNPEVVVFVDADCRLSPGSIEHLGRAVSANRTAIQAANHVEVPPSSDPRAVLSTLAFVIKNSVRPSGLTRMGCTVPLTGTGMAMPLEMALQLPFASGHLAEDMQMSLIILEKGHRVLPTAGAAVFSTQPSDTAVAITQRKRWEHGHLDLMIRRGIPTVLGGLARFSPRVVVAGLDLCIPPLALLVLLILLHLAASLGWWAAGGNPGPAALAAGLFLVLFAAVAGAKAAAAPHIPFLLLLSVPLYILWKVPLYLRFFAGRKQATWVRTDRSEAKQQNDKAEAKT